MLHLRSARNKGGHTIAFEVLSTYLWHTFKYEYLSIFIKNKTKIEINIKISFI